MNPQDAIDLGREALITALLISAPILLVGVVVGLLIGLVQALTQIQEMTLVFVPKIMAIFAALLIFLPLMGALLAGFSNQIFERIAAF